MATNSAINLATAAAGKLVQAQGIGVANDFTTATYPATSGSAGLYLVSDGTNIVGRDLGNLQLTAKTTLTSAQIKALHATPIQLIAAPGVGKMIIPVFASMKFTYGGTNVFVAGAAQVIGAYYSTTIAAITSLLSNTRLVGTASRWQSFVGGNLDSNTDLTNLAINLYNVVVTEISGNAANDNTYDVYMLYYIVSV